MSSSSLTITLSSSLRSSSSLPLLLHRHVSISSMLCSRHLYLPQKQLTSRHLLRRCSINADNSAIKLDHKKLNKGEKITELLLRQSSQVVQVMAQNGEIEGNTQRHKSFGEEMLKHLRDLHSLSTHLVPEATGSLWLCHATANNNLAQAQINSLASCYPRNIADAIVVEMACICISNGFDPSCLLHSSFQDKLDSSSPLLSSGHEFHSILTRLRRYGVAGVLSYGLLNTAYYLTTFLIVWFYVAPSPGRMGYLAAVERFLKVMAMVWAGSQVTKLVRAGGALALAPFVDRGLSWFTTKMNFESQGKAFMVIAGFCFGLAFMMFLIVTLLWA